MAGSGRDLHRGCARAREWVSLKLDGELSELERLLLRRHLARCGPCRALAESMETATTLVRLTPLERPTRRAAVAATALRRRGRRRLVAAVAAALAVGAAVGGAVVASDGGGSGPGQPRPPVEISQLPDPLTPTVTQPSENV